VPAALCVLTGVVAGCAAAGAEPQAHASATCSDYPTQQAAQDAADTRDADHDGIYCEDLPCPCSRESQAQHGRSTPAPVPTPRRRVHVGPSIAFRHHVRRSHCHSRNHGRLPDRGCTPGAYYKRATRKVICRSGYSRAIRHVSTATKRAVYRAYGIRHHTGARYEIDHLVPLEAGGSNARANLFPQAAKPRPGFHEKNRLENRVHHRICAGRLALRRTQRRIARNWLRVYRSAF
jgi:hypothetical protein